MESPLDHDPVEALRASGAAHLAEGRAEAAIETWRQALALAPDHVDIRFDLACAVQRLGRIDEATRLLEYVLAREPDRVEALNNLGSARGNQGRHDEAAALIERALRHQPDHPGALCNYGIVRYEQGRIDEAVALAERALGGNPDLAEAWNLLANLRREQGRYPAALECYARALAIDPGFAAARLNDGICRLAMGDFARGWRGYEWRGAIRPDTGVAGDLGIPRWTGAEDIRGRTLFLHAEQGLGDTIQFSRYALILSRMGAVTILKVPRALVALLAGVPGIGRVLGPGDAVPALDFECPLLSLPAALGTRLETIPSATVYLQAKPDRLAAWTGRLGPRLKPRIGLAWSGNPRHTNDRNRSIALSRLRPLLRRDFQFVSLQRDLRPADREALEAEPGLRHFGDLLDDFDDTAALASLMDVVISVDTSVAHLAAALGRRTWILLPHVPDWRWLLGRSDSPWYPTARLFRQPARGDWDGPIDAVAAALDALRLR
jgi:tetratricopeptide (TPR) repeat protein